MALDQYMVEWKQRLLAQGMEKGLQECVHKGCTEERQIRLSVCC